MISESNRSDADRLDTLERRFADLHESINNFATDINSRLDEITRSLRILGDERLTKGFDGLHESVDNFATANNLKVDELLLSLRALTDQRLPKTFEQIQASVNAAISGNSKLSKAVETLQATSDQAHARIVEELRRSINNRSLPRAQAKLAVNKASRKRTATNQLDGYRDLFDGLRPWSGELPKQYLVDCLGILTRRMFRIRFGVEPAAMADQRIDTVFPVLDGTVFPFLVGKNGELFFEYANWLLAAREACDQYVMVTLGACYGTQAVGACAALQLVNPMPYKLVAVEPEPENFRWMQMHMLDNGIDPEQQWLIPMAISDRNDPVLFPVGAPGSGANNCFATNDPGERKILLETIISGGKSDEVLRDLVLNNSTGMTKNLLAGGEVSAEIKSVSSITLRDILSPFDFVDYVEADMQQSEILVFPPHIDLLREKVRRIHIGTHGKEIHRRLHDLFEKSGWEMVFSYEPDSRHESELGNFETNDGILTVRNPDL